MVEDTLLLTEALAGTYPRDYIEQGGATSDDKTIAEHGKVADYIQDTLSEIGEVTVQSRELLRMRDVVHFRQVLAVTSTNVVADATTTSNGSSSSGNNSSSSGNNSSSSGSNSSSGSSSSGFSSNGNVSGESCGGGVLSGPPLLQWAARRLHPTPAVCGLPTGNYYPQPSLRTTCLHAHMPTHLNISSKPFQPNQSSRSHPPTPPTICGHCDCVSVHYLSLFVFVSLSLVLSTATARALIQKNEGFERGLYASYCGALTRHGGELMVTPYPTISLEILLYNPK